MSAVLVYGVDGRGYVRLIDRASNSWGGAMHVWVTVAETVGLLPPAPPDGAHDLERDRLLGGALTGSNDLFKRVWDEAFSSTSSLETWQQLVLASTLDRAMVWREDLPNFISAWERWLAWTPSQTMAREHEILLAAMADKRWRAVCWQQTTVSEDLWTVYDERTGKTRLWNVNRDEGGWNVYLEVPGARPAAAGSEETSPALP
jgi:hypothetical protein